MSMDYSPKSFGRHKPLVSIQIPATKSIWPTFKSCPKKNSYNLDQHCPILAM